MDENARLRTLNKHLQEQLDKFIGGLGKVWGTCCLKADLDMACTAEDRKYIACLSVKVKQLICWPTT